MIARCGDPEHPKYRLYGARGIAVCPEWQDFKAYLAAVEKLGPPPTPEHCTIGRADNDKGYEPGNIRWATHSEQMTNRRKYKNEKLRTDAKIRLTCEGKPITFQKGADLLGCRYDTLKKRLATLRKTRPNLTEVTVEQLRT
jgi:hypothetical protein